MTTTNQTHFLHATPAPCHGVTRQTNSTELVVLNPVDHLVLANVSSPFCNKKIASLTSRDRILASFLLFYSVNDIISCISFILTVPLLISRCNALSIFCLVHLLEYFYILTNI